MTALSLVVATPPQGAPIYAAVASGRGASGLWEARVSSSGL